MVRFKLNKKRGGRDKPTRTLARRNIYVRGPRSLEAKDLQWAMKPRDKKNASSHLICFLCVYIQKQINVCN